MHIRSIALALFAGGFVLLVGCGEAVKKAPVPLEQPLLPATVYVPSCPTFEGWVLGASDWAAGDLSCRLMRENLVKALQPVADKVRIVDYVWSKEADRFEVAPDKATEASIGSRYRVVLRPAYASRSRTPDISPPTPKGFIRTGQAPISVWEDFAVFSATSDEELGEASLFSMSYGKAAAQEIAPLVAGGIMGARCEALNKFSIKAISHTFNGCKTFALQPVD